MEHAYVREEIAAPIAAVWGEWSANFDPTPAAPPDVRDQVEKMYRGSFIANLKKSVAG